MTISFGSYILFIAATIALTQGVILVARNDEMFIRRIFFFIESIMCTVWAAGLAFFISERNSSDLVPIAIVYYVAAMAIAWSWLPLSYLFMNKKDSRTALRIAAISLLPLIMFASILAINPSFLIVDSDLGNNNTVSLNDFGYLIYCLLFITYCSLAFRFLFRGRAKAENILEKKQRSYVLFAFTAAFIFGTYFNLLLPALDDYRLVWIGPINIVIFSSVVYIAIMRYSLFNVGLRVARLLAGSIFLIIIFWSRFWLSSLIYSGSDISAQELFIDAGISVLYLVGSYFIIQFLLQSSNRLFRSGLLDDTLPGEVSRQSLSSTNTKKVLRNITAVISKHTKSNLVAVAVDSKDKQILESIDKPSFSVDDFRVVIDYMDRNRLNILITEELDLSDKIYNTLREYGMSVIVKSSSLDNGNDLSTYLIIGHKSRTLYSNRELEVLVSISGVILIALENTLYYERISRFNQELESRVSDATSSLRAVNSKLKKVDGSKDDFISMTSHQLRTPLTSVKGYISMILDGDFGHISSEQRRVLTEAYNSSERMAFLISDFLDVSRLQAGKFELQKSSTNLSDILKSEISQLKLTAEMHNVVLSYDITENLPVVELDHNKIRQVMMNMIDNAIYYSRNSSSVAVSLYSHDNNLIFTVVDHGIGVPRVEQSRLFTKFYRAANAQKVRPDGTGVGLYMARKVIVAHGGSIIFESKENLGSTFGFKLPI